jgi:hypothetical protein
MSVAEVSEGEQSLSTRVQAPPSGTKSAATRLQAGGQEAKGRAGHVDTRRVKKHAKPLVETVVSVNKPSTRGFTCVSA